MTEKIECLYQRPCVV